MSSSTHIKILPIKQSMQEETKNFFKYNWFKIILLIIIVVIISGAFYWYELRPSNIRVECKNEALRMGVSGIQNLGIDTAVREKLEEDKSTYYYNDCLNIHGLEK